jgi:hypothetical protein
MEARIAGLRESLGEAAFAATWAEGRAMGWREVVALKLDSTHADMQMAGKNLSV